VLRLAARRGLDDWRAAQGAAAGERPPLLLNDLLRGPIRWRPLEAEAEGEAEAADGGPQAAADAQGLVVRRLKAGGAPKDEVASAVARLKALKAAAGAGDPGAGNFLCLRVCLFLFAWRVV
jgi:hypothetical protein